MLLLLGWVQVQEVPVNGRYTERCERDRTAAMAWYSDMDGGRRWSSGASAGCHNGEPSSVCAVVLRSAARLSVWPGGEQRAEAVDCLWLRRSAQLRS